MHLHPSNEIAILLPSIFEYQGQYFLFFVAERRSGTWANYNIYFQPDATAPTMVEIPVKFPAGVHIRPVVKPLIRTPAANCHLFGVRRNPIVFPDIMDCQDVTRVNLNPATLAEFSKAAGVQLSMGAFDGFMNLYPQIVWDGAPSSTGTGSDDLIFTVQVDDAVGFMATGQLTMPEIGGDPNVAISFATISNGKATIVFNCGPYNRQPTGTYTVVVSDSEDTTPTESGNWPP